MATRENLMAAFTGESKANRMYLAFAENAEKDGFPVVAKLFRAAAAAETVHAHSHLRVMGDVKSTEDNLQAAVSGENHEYTEMYPGFIAEAEKEENSNAVRTFKFAMAVEKTHEGLYLDAQAAVKSGKDLDGGKIFVCPICGHTLWGEAPDKCPVCGAKKERFAQID